MDDVDIFARIMEVEDSLQMSHVFKNGFTNQPCHADSYRTLVDFVALDKWFKSQSFPPEILSHCLEYWTTNENMQPPLKLVASTVERLLKK